MKISDPVRDEYQRLAPDYDRRWAFYLAMTMRQTLARFPAGPGDSVLDIGCGTGIFLTHLAQRRHQTQLTGIDSSPEMLAAGKTKLPKTIKLCHARAEALPFTDESFHVVVSGSMFHYLRQPMLALREMQRVLRRGGQLVLTDWCADFLPMRLHDGLLRIFNRAHVKTYRQKELQRFLQETGFARIEIQASKINWFWGLMTVTATKNASDTLFFIPPVSVTQSKTRE